MIAITHPSPPDKTFWLNKSVEVRQKWTEHLYINYLGSKKILGDFLHKLAHCERSRRYQAMLIIGPTGSGKTTLASRMKDLAVSLYGRAHEEKTICPVIQFAVPDPCTPFEFSISILKALGDPDPRGRKHRADTIEAAERFLQECEVRLVLLDNFQDIPARRGKRGIELVGARLRELIDHSSALWVFLGTSEALNVVNSDAQLVKRISYRARLRYFSIVGDDAKTFVMLLRSLDKWVPLSQASCLVEPGTAALMYLATEGVFERIVQLVDSGWFIAVQAGRETMCLKDLEDAYAYVHGPQIDTVNPFHPDFIKRRLIGVNDPYEMMREYE